MSRRDAAGFRAELERAGLAVRLAKSGHYRVELPDGRFVCTLSQSPSDWRAVANSRSHIRRRLRELGSATQRAGPSGGPSVRSISSTTKGIR